MVRVLAGGVFDIIHPGHLFFLKKAAGLGDELVVVVATNRNAVEKGKKPVFSQEERKAMVEQIKYVDRAVIGEESQGDFLKIVEIEQPDIIALGHDQEFPGLENKLKENGLQAKVVKLKEKLEGYSTRAIVERIAKR